MFAQPIALRKYGAIIILTIQLLAWFLPANTKLALAQIGPCGTSAGASLAAFNTPASNEQVTVSKDVVDKAAFEALFKHRYTDAEKIYNIFAEYLMIFAEEADISSPDEFYQEFQLKFSQAIPPADLNNQNKYTYDDILHTAFDVALTMPKMKPLVPYIWEAIEFVGSPDSNGIELLGDSAAKVSASAWRYSKAAAMIGSISQELAQIRACAKANLEYAESFDERHEERLNASITDSALQFLNENPDVAFPEELKARIDDDGTITISIDELKAATEEEFEKLHATIDDIQGSLVEIDKQQKVIVEYLKNEELKAALAEKAKKEAAEFDLQLKASQASFTVISTLLSQLDPKIGKTASTVFNATQQVGQALSGWLKATSGLKGFDKVTSLSTIVMTGNVLGAVMNVMALFNNEPSIEQKILTQIGELRKQVDQVRVEMHSRFDRIDKSLNTIYATMQDRFNQVDVQLGKINGNLEEIQQSLGQLDVKLSRIEYNNLEMLNALGRRPLKEAINGGLNYLEVTGQPMPYEPNFVQFANTLYTWGTEHAYDALEAGPSQTDYSDAHVIDVLNAYGPDTNINYLNGWLLARGAPPITNKRIASPRDWLLTSRAYTQLGVEWPEHMGRYSAQRQADLDKVGAEIQAAITNISTLQTPNGLQGNHPLFNMLFANYQEKLNALLTAIETEVETPFNNEQGASIFNLFGGSQQVVNYVPAALAITTCGAFGTDVGVPSNLNKLIPNYELYSFAEYLGLGNFSSCASGRITNVNEVCNPKTLECHTMGTVSGSVSVGFEGVSFGMVGGSLGSVRLDDAGDLDSYLLANWGTIVAEMEAFLANRDPVEPGDPKYATLVTETTAKIERQLSAHQQELYVRVAQAVANGPLRPLAVELAGAKALLHTFASLGLSRAVANDEFLRAMLFGDQQVLEDQQILQSFIVSATMPITDVNNRVNVRLHLQQTAEARTTALHELINQYLDAIATGEHIDAPDYISGLRRTLDLSVRIAHLIVEEPLPPTPTVTPEPSATPLPSDTPQPDITPEPSETPQPDVTPEPSDTPQPDVTPEPSETPQPDVTPEPSETPQPDVTPEPSDTPQPDVTPEPSETPLPDVTPEPSETPQPDVTPEPGVTPAAEKMHIHLPMINR